MGLPVGRRKPGSCRRFLHAASRDGLEVVAPGFLLWVTDISNIPTNNAYIASGKTQAEAAGLLGVHEATVSRWVSPDTSILHVQDTCAASGDGSGGLKGGKKNRVRPRGLTRNVDPATT